MDRELSTRICRLVAGIVVSDDDLAPEEDAFIERMLARFGIPSEDRDTIFPIVDRTEAVEALHALPAEVQHEALAMLIDAACADGKVVAEERQYLHTVAHELGVTDADLDARIDAKLAK